MQGLSFNTYKDDFNQSNGTNMLVFLIFVKFSFNIQMISTLLNITIKNGHTFLMLAHELLVCQIMLRIASTKTLGQVQITEDKQCQCQALFIHVL